MMLSQKGGSAYGVRITSVKKRYFAKGEAK
jgi:hypothetical protein